jgi:hypothetical protein
MKIDLATKMIDGKKFYLLETYLTKEDAQIVATNYKKGLNGKVKRSAHVIPSKHLWELWVYPNNHKLNKITNKENTNGYSKNLSQ